MLRETEKPSNSDNSKQPRTVLGIFCMILLPIRVLYSFYFILFVFHAILFHLFYKKINLI